MQAHFFETEARLNDHFVNSQSEAVLPRGGSLDLTAIPAIKPNERFRLRRPHNSPKL
jgi:hypothetical protein